MNANSKTSSRSGFTLLELLVILGVIVILAAVMFPSLASAKRKSQRVNCVKNLSQVGLPYFHNWNGNQKYPMDLATAKGGTMEFITGADTFRGCLQPISSG